VPRPGRTQENQTILPAWAWIQPETAVNSPLEMRRRVLLSCPDGQGHRTTPCPTDCFRARMLLTDTRPPLQTAVYKHLVELQNRCRRRPATSSVQFGASRDQGEPIDDRRVIIIAARSKAYMAAADPQRTRCRSRLAKAGPFP
jgi:hypothetical protein